MNIVRYRHYDPFAEMDRMVRAMRSMPMAMDTTGSHALAVDVTENDDAVIVMASIPGVPEDKIEINVHDDNILTISAESEIRNEQNEDGWHIKELRYGRFSRSIQLPTTVDVDTARAETENGILTVTLPKTEPSPIRKIAVKARKMLTGENE